MLAGTERGLAEACGGGSQCKSAIVMQSCLVIAEPGAQQIGDRFAQGGRTTLNLALASKCYRPILFSPHLRKTWWIRKSTLSAVGGYCYPSFRPPSRLEAERARGFCLVIVVPLTCQKRSYSTGLALTHSNERESSQSPPQFRTRLVAQSIPLGASITDMLRHYAGLDNHTLCH